MENKINFTGIKNIAAIDFKRSHNTASKSLSFVLTDDHNGKDLTEFKKVISGMTQKESAYKNSEYPDILNIECIQNSENQEAMLINGTPLTLEYKDLDMFSYLAKLMDRIKNMRQKDLVVNNDYVEYAAPETLVHDVILSPMEGNSDKKFLRTFFTLDSVKEGSEFVGEFIKRTMYDFLDIPY